MGRLILVCVVLATGLVVGEAWATGMMTRQPELVDAKCRPVTQGAKVQGVWVSGRGEAITSAPGGPSQHHIMPLRWQRLRVLKQGCQHVERTRFVRDGKCNGLPRYRWMGVVRPGEAYTVVYGGGHLGQVGKVDPERALKCPAPPAPLFDEWTAIGAPIQMSITVPRATIDAQGSPTSPQISFEAKAIVPHAKIVSTVFFNAFAPKHWSADRVLGTSGDEVVFEVLITRRRHRHEFVDEEGLRDVLKCLEETEEKIELRRPGVPMVWMLDSIRHEKPKMGKCSK